MEKCIMDYEQMVMREIENCIAKGELNPTDIKNVGEAVDILKDLYTIDAMKQGGYSSENYPRDMGEYPMDRGNSNRMYDEGYDRRSSYAYPRRPYRGYARDNMRDW